MLGRNKKGQFAKGISPNKTSFGKGHISWNKGTKGIIKSNKTSFSKEHNHPQWKGDKAGYNAMHSWVIKQKGKAKNYQCIDCEKQAEHWANKKHDYKRNLDDYVPMCKSCHKKYDIKYNNVNIDNFKHSKK